MLVSYVIQKHPMSDLKPTVEEQVECCNRYLGQRNLGTVTHRFIDGHAAWVLPLFERPAGRSLASLKAGDQLVIANPYVLGSSAASCLQSLRSFLDNGLVVYVADLAFGSGIGCGSDQPEFAPVMQVLAGYVKEQKAQRSRQRKRAHAWRRAQGLATNGRAAPGFKVTVKTTNGKPTKYLEPDLRERALIAAILTMIEGGQSLAMVHDAIRKEPGRRWSIRRLRRYFGGPKKKEQMRRLVAGHEFDSPNSNEQIDNT